MGEDVNLTRKVAVQNNGCVFVADTKIIFRYDFLAPLMQFFFSLAVLL